MSNFIHTFGAYYGLSVAWILNTGHSRLLPRIDNTSSYFSDLFAMIGTIFLWIYWPSFNGALAVGKIQQIVIVNTVLSLSASCIMAFITSKWIHGKFNMVEVQNATLAGGVAIGSAANMINYPYASIVIGLFAGFISVIGYKYISPFINKQFGIDDTCGVHNLHGLPGIIGGISGFIFALIVNLDMYDDISDIFPERENGRTALTQALYQLATLGTTIGISIVSGLLVGLLTKKIGGLVEYYSDDAEWEVPPKPWDFDKLYQLSPLSPLDNRDAIISVTTIL